MKQELVKRTNQSQLDCNFSSKQDEMAIFSSKSDEMVILLSLLEGITANTTNGDVIYLSVLRAKGTCQKLGIDGELAEDIIRKYLRVAKNIRSKNVMAWD